MYIVQDREVTSRLNDTTETECIELCQWVNISDPFWLMFDCCLLGVSENHD